MICEDLIHIPVLLIVVKRAFDFAKSEARVVDIARYSLGGVNCKPNALMWPSIRALHGRDCSDNLPRWGWNVPLRRTMNMV